MLVAQPITDYYEVRDSLSSGDQMVLNRPGWISRHGRSTASHVGTLVWREADQNTLSVAESREGKGGRIVSLSTQVRKYPGLIDIYTPTAGCSQPLRERAATIAYNWAGNEYGYLGIAQRGLVHFPLLYELAHALGYRPDLTDLLPSPWNEPKVCSGLNLWVYRWAKLELTGMLDAPDDEKRLWLTAGWDPCPMLGDRWVEPGDLLRGGGFKLLAKGLVI